MDSRQSSGSRSSSPIRLPPTRTSCDVCKRLKIKCERRGESCVHCLGRGTKCTTTVIERKKRQPNRGSSLLDIESRIKRMESVITASGLGAQWDGGVETPSEKSESPSADTKGLTDRLSTLLIHDDGSAKFIGSSSGFSLFSPQGLQWISEKTGSDGLNQFISDLLRKMKDTVPPNTTELWQPTSSAEHPTEQEPLPPRVTADRYVHEFFDSYNSIFPLYDRVAFDQNYELQYAGKPPTGVAWYASLNIIFCIGSMLAEHDNPQSVTAPDAKWKKYFRNVSSRFAELMFEECSLLAVQAICAMAVVQQMILQPQAVFVLVAIAARLASSIGLHRNLNHAGLSEEEITQRQNVFWIIYFMDKSFALRLGHPSVMSDDDIGIDLPQENDILERRPDGSARYGIFRHQVQLALLESRIYSELYSARAQTRPALTRLKLVGELDRALGEWKDALPVDIQPEKPIKCLREQFLPILMIHFSYFNCLTTIHRVSIHHGSWTNAHTDRGDSPLHNQQINPRVYASQSICVSAARQSIGVLRTVDFQDQSTCNGIMWLLLHYPLSAFLTLFANAIQNPSDRQVASDLELMDLITSFFTVPERELNHISASTPLVFRELKHVAAKFVERTKSRAATTKRTREAYDTEQDQTQELTNGSRRIESSSQPNCHSKVPEPMISSTDPLYQTGDLSTGPFDIPHTDGQVQQDQYPSEYMDPFVLAMPSQSSLPDSQNNLQPPPVFSDYFEWDLANLWNFDPLQGV